MKDTVKTIINHPISTSVVVGAIFSGVATVITAVKGNGNKTNN